MKTLLLTGASAMVIAGSLYNMIGGGTGQKRKTCYSYSKNNDSTRVNWRHQFDEENDDVYESVYEAFCDTVLQYGEKNCYGVRELEEIVKEKTVVNGVEKEWQYYQMGGFKWLTYVEFKRRVDAFGSALRALGLKTGDNLGIYEETKMEWTISAMGAMSQNITVLTVYANLGDEAVSFALNQGECSHVVTSADLLKSILNQIDEYKFLDTLIYIGKGKEEDIQSLKDKGIHVYSFEEIIKIGEENPTPSQPQSRETLALIMYTSGSTGMPKGVMVKNKNFLTTIYGVFKGIEVTSDDVYLSFLPLAHILALDVECALLIKGCTIGTGSPRTLTDQNVRNCQGDLSELKPTLFVGVPSILGRISKAIHSKVEKSSSIAQLIFNTGFNCKVKSLKDGFQTPIWDRLLFNKLKGLLGGKVRVIVSGGAPLSEHIATTLFGCFGIPILQGYGLTETCGGGSVVELEDSERGHTGPPVYGVTIKLVDVPEMSYTVNDKPNMRGEIYIKGVNVSDGYYKLPEKTEEDFDEEGWFHTGDIGEWLPNGCLKIIDRKKNLIKPPHGEYIAVEKLESIYQESELVESICVVAKSDYNEVVAVIYPHQNLKEWASSQNINKSWEDLCVDPKAEKAVIDSLNRVWGDAHLKSIERIRAIRLTPEEWTPDNNLMTAVMKLKRKEVNEEFQGLIEDMYSHFEQD